MKNRTGWAPPLTRGGWEGFCYLLYSPLQILIHSFYILHDFFVGIPQNMQSTMIQILCTICIVFLLINMRFTLNLNNKSKFRRIKINNKISYRFLL